MTGLRRTTHIEHPRPSAAISEDQPEPKDHAILIGAMLTVFIAGLLIAAGILVVAFAHAAGVIGDAS